MLLRAQTGVVTGAAFVSDFSNTLWCMWEEQHQSGAAGTLRAQRVEFVGGYIWLAPLTDQQVPVGEVAYADDMHAVVAFSDSADLEHASAPLQRATDAFFYSLHRTKTVAMVHYFGDGRQKLLASFDAHENGILHSARRRSPGGCLLLAPCVGSTWRT